MKFIIFILLSSLIIVSGMWGLEAAELPELEAQIQYESHKLEQVTQALHALQNTGDTSPFEVAEILFAAGLYAAAAPLYKQVISDTTLSHDVDLAYFRLIRLSYALHQFENLRAYHASLIRNYPHSQWVSLASYLAALSYYQERDWQGVTRTAQWVVAEHPAYSYAQHLLGHSYLQLNQYEAAEVAFQNALKTSAGDALCEKARFGLAETYRRTQKYDQALNFYQMISTKSAIYPDVRFAQGWLLIEQGNIEAGSLVLQQVMTDFPRTPAAANAAVALGHLALNQHQYVRADDLYHTAIMDFIAINPFYLPAEQALVRKIAAEKKWIAMQKVKLASMTENAGDDWAFQAKIYDQMDVLEALTSEITELEVQLTGTQIEAKRERLLNEIASEQNRVWELQNALSQLQQRGQLAVQATTVETELQALIHALDDLEYSYNDFQYEKIQQLADAEYGLVATAYAMAAEGLIPYEMAAHRHQTFLDIYPNSKYLPRVLLQAAELAYLIEHEKFLAGWVEQPDHRQALRYYQQVIDFDPQGELAEAAYYGAGYCYSEMGDLEAAATTFEALVTAFPTSMYAADSYLRWGDALLALNQPEQAAEAYQAVLPFEEDPLSARALFRLGKMYYQMEAYEQSITAFAQVVDDQHYRALITPEEYQQAQHWVLNSLLTFEDAPEVARRTLQRAGAQTYAYEVMTRLAEVYQVLDKTDAAFAMYQHLLEMAPLHPHAPQISLKMINCKDSLNVDQLWRQKRLVFERYQPHSEWYRAQSPEVQQRTAQWVEDGMYTLAAEAHQQGHYRDAIELYSQFLTYFPKSERALAVNFYRGECYWEMGQFEKARLDYQFVALAPDNPFHVDAAYTVIACLDTLNRIAPNPQTEYELLQACTKFIKLTSDDPRRAEVLLKQGELYLNQHDYDRAAEIYTYVAQNYQADPDVYPVALELTVHAYELAGKRDVATSWRQQIYADNRVGTALKAKMRDQLRADVYRQVNDLKAQGDLLGAVAELERFAASHSDWVAVDVLWWDAAQLGRQAGTWDQAARCYQRIVQDYPASEYVPRALFRWGECLSEMEDWRSARDVFLAFAQRYPDQELVLEARCRAVLALTQTNPDENRIRQECQMILAESPSPIASLTDRLWLARCAYLLAEMDYEAFQTIALVEPLDQNFAAKQHHMDNALHQYSRVVDLAVAETTLPALFRIGQIYERFLVDLWTSERPAGLDEAERMAYNVQLEDQLIAYEAKALAAYQAVQAQAAANQLAADWQYRAQTRETQIKQRLYLETEQVVSDAQWKVSVEDVPHWIDTHFDDQNWQSVKTVPAPGITSVVAFTSLSEAAASAWVWYPEPIPQIRLRRTFTQGLVPLPHDLNIWSITPPRVWINGEAVVLHRTQQAMQYRAEITPYLQAGLNAIAIEATIPSPSQQGIRIESRPQMMQSRHE
ncbi:MAG: hypothetical protein D6675_15185 [Gemmatimonadetes bacterium]|nr:MAG: hypothetical protein D6675_15185 [Gemmatimonadota bacterium]